MTMEPPPDRPDTPSWGYGTHDGPACWGSLDPAFALCARGREQSPIDLAGGTRRGGDPGGGESHRAGSRRFAHEIAAALPRP